MEVDEKAHWLLVLSLDEIAGAQGIPLHMIVSPFTNADLEKRLFAFSVSLLSSVPGTLSHLKCTLNAVHTTQPIQSRANLRFD